MPIYQSYISSPSATHDPNAPIVLRDEQKKAVSEAKKRFNKADGRKFLWNAKMRFGKTLSSLQLIKDLNLRRTLIVTHRPVVDTSFRDDFNKIFRNSPQWEYASRSDNGGTGEIASLEKKLKEDDSLHYVFFASMQYLCRSDLVNSKPSADSNPLKHLILNNDWDLVIIDEAHEATTGDTQGAAVVKYLASKKANMLHLSGTPFNLYDDFEDNEIYTWDYIQEQTRKRELRDAGVPDAENPYITLPEMKIFTYDLAKLRGGDVKTTNQFTLSEFFRVWTGNPKTDKAEMPAGAKGKFVHEEAVKIFLDLLCSEDGENNYPFSTEEYRDNFMHTFWVLPGVNEAKALEMLMKEHRVFSDEFFKVINVAGAGESQAQQNKALERVIDAIGKAPDQTRTITLSCSRLTTGVTVEPWTAVFYLKGSENTSAATYMQTIFRVQSPHVYNGKMKSECYVFDFAPDRSLRAVAETAKFYNLTQKERKVASQASQDSDLKKMREFLSFCPVISLDGGRMVAFDEHKLFTRLNGVYIDRIVSSGYTDNALFNKDAIMQMDPDALSVLDNLDPKECIHSKGKTKCNPKLNINNNGLNGDGGAPDTDPGDGGQKGKKLTPEQKEERKKKAEELEKRRAKLRDITIRIPLLIFGGSFKEEGDITLDNFTRRIHDESWAEFMPRSVSKDDFNKLKKGINASMFVEAGKRIRQMTRQADSMHVEERIAEITKIHKWFNNPSKETVLTPWRVVNMHLSDCLGGYCFFNENFTGPNQIEVEGDGDQLFDFEDTIMPRFVDRGKVTADVFGSGGNSKGGYQTAKMAKDGSLRPGDDLDIKILEINSKTGLYPLYATYSLYRSRLKDFVAAGLIGDADNLSIEEEQVVWDDVIQNNLYVICNTDMAEAITRRTLYGFREVSDTHIKHEPIITRAKADAETLAADLRREGYWNGTTSKTMLKFTAVIGNPPYQVMDGGINGSSMPVYDKFVKVAKSIDSTFVSLIMPSRWFAGGKGLDEFRKEMIADTSISVLHDFLNGVECFGSNVEIKGGVCFFLRDASHSGECIVTTHKEGKTSEDTRYLKQGDSDVIIRHAEGISIFHKVVSSDAENFSKLVSSQRPFGMRTYVKGSPTAKEGYVKLYQNGGVGYVDKSEISRNIEWIHLPKILVSSAYNAGDNYPHQILGKPILSEKGSCCTETYVVIGPFITAQEAENCMKYIQTKFLRVMVMFKKSSQHAAAGVYSFVPLQDFTAESDIDWSKDVADIDRQLYAKYGLDEEEIAFIERMIKPM